MIPEEFEEIKLCIENGKLEMASQKLEPFLIENDLDARFLRSSFSLDPNLSGAEFDAWRIGELMKLAKLKHVKSLYAVAWAFRFGDDVPADQTKFLCYLEAAALLGNPEAKEDLVREVCLEFGWRELL